MKVLTHTEVSGWMVKAVAATPSRVAATTLESKSSSRRRLTSSWLFTMSHAGHSMGVVSSETMASGSIASLSLSHTHTHTRTHKHREFRERERESSGPCNNHQDPGFETFIIMHNTQRSGTSRLPLLAHVIVTL
ncbi:hypothetical protein GOP47_0010963 [Adiantum capillus-veneris]|uniref:Uncharacterized protein n=1 Tax=Adiantum capillus-veneris TaxID=13818 RepID=A0A9D4UWE3_ADICA|nr:hypothetical protein GOP47_0010963 [Adiantum capillus-veneris]